MFSKNNPKSLNITNILLLLQVLFGCFIVIRTLIEILFPVGYTNMELNQRIILSAIAETIISGLTLFLISVPLRKFFNPSLIGGEKAFKIVSLIVLNGAMISLSASLIFLPSARNISTESMFQTIADIISILAVFIILLIIAIKLKLFRQDFSSTLNNLNCILLLSLGYHLCWFIHALIVGPNPNIHINYFYRDIFSFIAFSIVLVTCIIIVTINGEKISKPKILSANKDESVKKAQEETKDQQDNKIYPDPVDPKNPMVTKD